MTMWLKQSTTITLKMGPFLDKTDGVTEETALSPAVELSKNGGAFAARSSATAITHDAGGWYAVEVNATDTNTLGRLQVKSDDAATHLPVWHEFMVVPANVYDSLIGGSDQLQVDTIQWAGAATATDDVALATAPANFAALSITAAGLVELSAAGVSAIWDKLTSALTTAGSIGKLLVDNVNATISSRASQTSVDTIDDFVDTEVAAILAAVDTEVAAIKAVTDALPNGGALTNLDAAISSRATPAQVNAEVLDVMNVDTYVQPGQENPPATTTLTVMIRYLFKAWRNKYTQTSSLYSLFADNGTTVDHKATTSDDGTTYTHEEVVAGP